MVRASVHQDQTKMMSSIFSFYFKKPKIVYSPNRLMQLTPSYHIQQTVDPKDPEMTDVILFISLGNKSEDEMMNDLKYWLINRPNVIVNIVIGSQQKGGGGKNISIMGEFFWNILCLLTTYPHRTQLLNTPGDIAHRDPPPPPMDIKQ
jgi:hypothetical protein